MPEDRSEEQNVFFQTAVITFRHPGTGDLVKRNFVGRAFFTPEEITEFGDVKVEEIFEGFQLDKPYNPYQDDENVEAHRQLTDLVRETLDKQQK